MSGITTKIDDSVIVNTVVGQVGFDDLVEFITENNDSWIGRPVIWDIAEFDLGDISDKELRKFTETMASTSENRKGDKSAIVAPQDLQFGMMKALETLAEIASYPVRIRVFRKIADAKKWLSEESE